MEIDSFDLNIEKFLSEVQQDERHFDVNHFN